eukprot:TRINITY_DN6725_c0_g1_i1.p1 TRINITY_DN6725_c0_g1~~TRINITY_DN6725_c0_g1_i1.p1  ORF type:complete len:298 (+),score=58.96 TRINITY_DN6725_c0_g1_i1:46-939(+)
MSHWEIPFKDLVFGDKLGEGSFGAVYAGSYLKTPIAIKKLFFTDDDFMLKYIAREMDLLTAVHHPNIVRLMGLSIDNGPNDMYIIMEFIKGGSLRNKLKDTSIKISWSRKVDIALQVARAMTYLHSRNVIHRDLKSHNLLVADGWKIKVCDFGLARQMQESEGGEEVDPMGKIDGTIVGTDFWMSPEVALGNTYDKSCDLFSFAMVLFEIFTRNKPLKRSLKPVNGLILVVVPEVWKKSVPKDTPPALWELFLQCSQYEPSKRPEFRDVIKTLNAIQESLPKKKKKASTKKKKKRKK